MCNIGLLYILLFGYRTICIPCLAQIDSLVTKLGLTEEDLTVAWDDFHAKHPEGEIGMDAFLEISKVRKQGNFSVANLNVVNFTYILFSPKYCKISKLKSIAIY